MINIQNMYVFSVHNLMSLDISTYLWWSCSFARSCPTLCDLMNCSTPDFPVLHCLLEFAQLVAIESVMPFNHFILWCPLLILPSILLSIRVFSSDTHDNDLTGEKAGSPWKNTMPTLPALDLRESEWWDCSARSCLANRGRSSIGERFRGLWTVSLGPPEVPEASHAQTQGRAHPWLSSSSSSPPALASRH